jgi:Uma2 family endonuclease
MAQQATPERIMSIEEYLEFENNSEFKHEYVGWHLYAMTGVTRRQSRISGNIFALLREAAKAGPCRIHQSDMRVPTPDGPVYYPDVVVACGEEPDDPYCEDTPCLIIEVLSPSTALTDRREKLLSYRRISSLQAYLIVEQDKALVERHYRDDSGAWQAEILSEGGIPVPCPQGVELSLTGIYVS